MSPDSSLPVLGWKERVTLPDWEVGPLPAKLDTGARTSALHVEDLTTVGEREATDRPGEQLPRLRFTVLWGGGSGSRRVSVAADAVAYRRVRDTRARSERRPVVRTRLTCGPLDVPAAEITLTSRHGMNFRMLLGRLTLERRCLVDPGRDYLHTRRPAARSGP